MPRRHALIDEILGPEKDAGSSAQRRAPEASPAALTGAPANLLNLQRTAGNRAVTSVIQRLATDKEALALEGVDVKALIAANVKAQAGPARILNKTQTKLPAREALPAPGRLAPEGSDVMDEWAKSIGLGKVLSYEGRGRAQWNLDNPELLADQFRAEGVSGPVAHGQAESLATETSSQRATEMIATSKEIEGRVTPDVIADISSFQGTRIGAEYVLKGQDSLARKLAQHDDKDQWREQISDSLRYTIIYPAERITEAIKSKFVALENQSEGDGKKYQKTKVKNTLANENAIYRGVNTNWRHLASGLKFEIQFHTPESYTTKQTVNHLPYEAARVLAQQRQGMGPVTENEYFLNEQMQAVSGKLKLPKDIAEIKDQ